VSASELEEPGPHMHGSPERSLHTAAAVGTHPPASLVIKPALQIQSETESLPAGAYEFDVQLKQNDRPGDNEYFPKRGQG